MSAYTEQYTQTAHEKSAHLCQAYGCPLDGTISAAIGPEAHYCCRYHYQATPDDWQELTRRIHQNLSLIHHIRRLELLRTDAWFHLSPNGLAERERIYHYPGHEKADHESHDTYTHRLQTALRQRLNSRTEEQETQSRAIAAALSAITSAPGTTGWKRPADLTTGLPTRQELTPQEQAELLAAARNRYGPVATTAPESPSQPQLDTQAA